MKKIERKKAKRRQEKSLCEYAHLTASFTWSIHHSSFFMFLRRLLLFFLSSSFVLRLTLPLKIEKEKEKRIRIVIESNFFSLLFFNTLHRITDLSFVLLN
jgi:hypothetical protein